MTIWIKMPNTTPINNCKSKITKTRKQIQMLLHKLEFYYEELYKLKMEKRK